MKKCANWNSIKLDFPAFVLKKKEHCALNRANTAVNWQEL